MASQDWSKLQPGLRVLYSRMFARILRSDRIKRYAKKPKAK